MPQNLVDFINWDHISETVFENRMAPSDCIFEFLKLPISESLKLDLETTGEKTQIPTQDTSQADQTKPVGSGCVPWNSSQASASVFMDASNPLLSQIAIFARLLELREKGSLDVD